MPSWFFETGNPPFLEGYAPAPGSIGAASNTLVEVDLVDAESYVDILTIDAYVDAGGGEAHVYDGYTDTFFPPYNGPLSALTFIPGGSIDGYDAYNLLLDRTTDYPPGTLVTVRVVADDYGGNTLDGSWNFTTATLNPPIVLNKTPAPNSNGNAPDVLVSMDIVDPDGDLDLSTIFITVEGAPAYAGSGFNSPFTGPNSAATTTTVDGYDGYHFVIDNNDLFSDIVVVRVEAADFTGNSVTDQWSFLIGTNTVRTLYFSDGYGVKKINVRELAGESQDKVRTVLSTVTSPSLPKDVVSSISGQFVGSDFFLAVSLDGYGTASPGPGKGTLIVKNEVDDPRIYADGYHVKNAQLTDRGTMYLVNKTENRVEVYYGAHFRDGYRAPDFVYDQSSTPGLLSGEILDLHVAPGESLVCDGGSRIYVGTETGLSRIETCDLDSPDGYSSGQDGYGTVITYGIPGSGADHEVLGGTAPQVVSVHSDETFEVLLIATDDGYGNGGLTQVSLSGNRQISFLTEDEDTLPSDRIRDVFGRKI